MNVLGSDAKPLAMQAHIKQKFDKVLPTQIISNYKFQVRKHAARRPAAVAVPPRGLKIEDFEAVRGLVTRLGADQVKRIADVVG